MKKVLFALPFLFLLSLSLKAADLDPYQKCLLKVSEENFDAKVAFQTGLADLITEAHPEFGNLAILSRDLQIAFATAQRTRLDFLITEDVAQLVSASGLVRFNNFEWEDRHEVELQSENPDYLLLLDRIKLLGEENNNHPSWPGLREKFIELQKSKDFTGLLDDLTEAQEKAEKRLENC